MNAQAFICDAVRTPFGRYGGALSLVRADDLGGSGSRWRVPAPPDHHDAVDEHHRDAGQVTELERLEGRI